GVEIETIKRDTVTINYVGTLKSNGKQFDASGSKPFKCRIGVGEVIQGWDEGVVQLSLGQKARLIITSDYAYGSKGFSTLIPPNSDLVL
ncbi:18632_t:CDS:2, partial [Funneliformis geosporum]